MRGLFVGFRNPAETNMLVQARRYGIACVQSKDLELGVGMLNASLDNTTSDAVTSKPLPDVNVPKTTDAGVALKGISTYAAKPDKFIVHTSDEQTLAGAAEACCAAFPIGCHLTQEIMPFFPRDCAQFFDPGGEIRRSP